MRQQAESCNLGHTFLANSVVVLKKTRHPIVQIRVQNYNHGFAEQRLSLSLCRKCRRAVFTIALKEKEEQLARSLSSQ